MNKKAIEKELTKLFKTFYSRYTGVIAVRCLDFYNDYQPSRGDEVATYRYKVHITIGEKVYTYEGWCYDDEFKTIALGIYSHWLLNNCEIYKGPSTAWYTSYTGFGNIQEKGE